MLRRARLPRPRKLGLDSQRSFRAECCPRRSRMSGFPAQRTGVAFQCRRSRRCGPATSSLGRLRRRASGGLGARSCGGFPRRRQGNCAWLPSTWIARRPRRSSTNPALRIPQVAPPMRSIRRGSGCPRLVDGCWWRRPAQAGAASSSTYRTSIVGPTTRDAGQEVGLLVSQSSLACHRRSRMTGSATDGRGGVAPAAGERILRKVPPSRAAMVAVRAPQNAIRQAA